MLAELLEHDHGQQAWASPSPRDGMERRWRLTDLLAVTAGELLPHRLDHLPLPRDHFPRLRHILAELAQAVAAAAGASCRRFDDDPLARQMHRKGLALGGALAHKSLDRRRFRHLERAITNYDCNASWSSARDGCGTQIAGKLLDKTNESGRPSQQSNIDEHICDRT